MSKIKMTSARPAAAAQVQRGRASRVINPFKLRSGDLVLVAARKSNRQSKSNIPDQLNNLRPIVNRSGAAIVGYYSITTSGIDPSWVADAVTLARKLHANVILAEAANRLIRNKHYHSKERPEVQATDADLDELSLCAKGMKLMTFVHPDTPEMKVRSYQTKRGQQQKNHKGGRPRKREPGEMKLRREKLRPKVRKLRRNGFSIRQLAQNFDVSKSTIEDWLKT